MGIWRRSSCWLGIASVLRTCAQTTHVRDVCHIIGVVVHDLGILKINMYDAIACTELEKQDRTEWRVEVKMGDADGDDLKRWDVEFC